MKPSSIGVFRRVTLTVVAILSLCFLLGCGSFHADATISWGLSSFSKQTQLTDVKEEEAEEIFSPQPILPD